MKPSRGGPSRGASVSFLVSGLLMCCVVALSPPVRAQSKSNAEGIRWVKSLGVAIRAANSSKRPVMVHFNKDTDAVCNEMARVHFKDPRIVALSKKFVCTIASPSQHASAGRHKKCSRFPGVRCKEHQRAWKATSQRVSKSPRPTAPQFVFLRPDRQQILRRRGELSVEDLAWAMEEALEYYEGNRRKVQPNVIELFKRANANRQSTRVRAIRQLASIQHPRVVAFMGQQVKSEAGEVKRQEAIKAMKASVHANHLPHIIPLLFEASGQLRRNAVFALRNLGMVECVPGLLECYARENTNRMKALILRTAARMDPKNEKLLKIHRYALKKGPPMIRIHAIRACVDLDIRDKEFWWLIEMARAGTSMRVQALSCWAATEILLRSRKPVIIERDVDGGTESDGYARTRDRPFAKEIIKMTPKLGHALRQVAEAGRTARIRAYATECVKALDGEPSNFRSQILQFHDDARDEIFKEY